MSYIIAINGIKMKFLGDINDNTEDPLNLEPNRVAFSVEKKVYPFSGIVENESEIPEDTFGIYFNSENDEYLIVGKSKYSLKNVKEKEETNDNSGGGLVLSDDLLKELTDIKNDENIKKKKRNARKSSTQRANDYIRFEINDDDDLMVRLIKERINEVSITMNDVYEMYPTEGYNLYYGLLNRNTITFKSLQKWCEITNSEFDMVIRDKK